MVPTSTIGGPMEFTLRLIGIWPESSCKLLQLVVWTTAMATSQIFQYWYLFTHIGSDTLADLMHSLSLCLSNSLLYLKLNVLWLNRRIIYDIFATMAEDWNECADSKTQMMISKAILSHRISKYTIAIYVACIILLGTSNVLARKSAGAERAVEGRQLLVKMELPFECSESPLYEIVMIAQFLLQNTLALTAGMLNALVVTLILHIAGQIDIICHELLEISVAERNERESRVHALRALVNRHQRIIALADSVEDVFCYTALMQFLSNMLVICFLGFLLVIKFDSTEVLIKIVPYYAVVNLEAFILCFTGEYLSSKSRSISRAAYDSLWYELKPAESKILLLLMLKSQKQLTLTIGKFMDLSLEGFTNILKASASYVSVLHAMY